MNHEIKNLETVFEVVYPNQKKIEQAKKLLKDRIDYLECISKLHPNYQHILDDIENIKKQINNLKNK